MSAVNFSSCVTTIAGRWALNETLGQLTLAFPRQLSYETVTVRLKFNYTLKEGLSGFYRSQYTGLHPLE